MTIMSDAVKSVHDRINGGEQDKGECFRRCGLLVQVEMEADDRPLNCWASRSECVS